MKKVFVAIFFALFVIAFSSKQNLALPQRVPIDTSRCCKDNCTIPDNYGDKDRPGDYYSADIRIDSFFVRKDGPDHLLLNVRVTNVGDDNAHEARLVVLLPIDVSDIRVLTTDPKTKQYNQCGGRIEFCLGSVGVLSSGDSRHVTIRTSTAKIPYWKNAESFAGFTYSSTPDQCPLNNYRAWVNDKVACYPDFDPRKLVKKGF